MRITASGFATIALLTTILWGCIVFEHLTVIRARAGAERALNEIRLLQLKKRIIPTAVPMSSPRSTPPEIG